MATSNKELINSEIVYFPGSKGKGGNGEYEFYENEGETSAVDVDPKTERKIRLFLDPKLQTRGKAVLKAA